MLAWERVQIELVPRVGLTNSDESPTPYDDEFNRVMPPNIIDRVKRVSTDSDVNDI